MSKIICDVCGTSYSDNSAQCPICGYVNPGMTEFDGQENGDVLENSEYTYTKGGHFSKSNVRKRIKNNPVEEYDEYGATEDYEPESRRREAPLIVVAVILLLAIAAVVLFITMRYFKPVDHQPDAQNEHQSQQTTTEQSTTVRDTTVACTKLEVSETQITIAEGSTYELSVIKEPVDTTDKLVFESNAPDVATVDEKGVITPVKTGTAIITVICGEQKLEITVSCEVNEENAFVLSTMELKLSAAGETWDLYDGPIAMEEVEFTSEDDKVATVDENGLVTAVAEGTTIVHAKYGDQTISCNVTCEFKKDDEQGNEGGVNEDGTQTDTQPEVLLTKAPNATGTKGYKIVSNFGDAYVNPNNPALFDVGHKVGLPITLRLVDEFGNRLNATWTVFNTSICKAKVEGGCEFNCLAVGKAFVVATTEDGETYVCIIRVTA